MSKVKLSAYIDKQETLNNINNIIDNLKLNNINLDINFNIKDLNSKINNIYSDLNKSLNKNIETPKINNNKTVESIEQTGEIVDKLINKIKQIKGNSISIDNILGDNVKIKDTSKNIDEILNKVTKISSTSSTFKLDDDMVKTTKNVTTLKDELGNSINIIKDLQTGITTITPKVNFEKEEKELDKFNQRIKEMQEITSLYKNTEIIKPDTINKIDKAINKLDFFKSTEEDIQKVQDRVNRLSSSENGIVKLRDIISQIKNEKLKLQDNGDLDKVDTKSIDDYKQSLKEAEKLLDKFRNNSPNITNGKVSETINNLKSSFSNIQSQVKEYDSLANAMAKVREQSELKSNNQTNKDELSQINAINKSLEEEYRQRQKLQETLSNSSNKLNILSNNEIVDKNLITQAENDIKSIQSIFNNFNTDKSEKEIDELLTKITRLSQEDLSKMTKTEKLDTAVKSVSSNVNNISKSESQILTLNKTINTLENNLDALKTKYDKLVKINPESLQKFNSELEKLKTISSNVKSGDIIDGQKIKSQCDVARDSLSKLENEVKKDGFRTGKQDVNSFGEAVKNAFGNVGIYYGSSVAIREMFNAMKQGVQDVISVESAFVSLRRIIDMTDEDAKNLQTEFGKMALNLATSTTNITNSITDFAKLGYTLDEAKMLATETQKFNLAGDINNLDEATTDVVSTLKGFKLEANDVTDVVDKMNTASNKYAVSAKDIAEILKRSSSALSVAGNDIKESISLGTVANETIQDASRVGTALKTLSTRMIKVTKEDPKYREKLLNIANVDIMDGDKFKSTFEIFKELGAVWDKLSDVDKSNIGSNLFGAENINTAYAILENYKQLDNVMNDLEDSAGSVNDEYNRHMDSTKAKIEQFKEEVSQIWTNLISSDLTKGVMDSANKLIKLFGDGKLVLASFGLVLSSIFKGKVGNDLFTSFTNLIQKIRQAKQEGNLLGKTINKIGKTQLFLSAIIAGLTIFDIISSKIQENKEQMEEFNKSTIEGFNKTNEEISNAEDLLNKKTELENKINEGGLTSNQQLETKNELLDIERQLAEILPNSASGYDKQNKKIAENTDLIKEQIEAKKQQSIDEANKVLENNGENFLGFDSVYKQIQEAKALKQTLNEISNAKDSGENVAKSFSYNPLWDSTSESTIKIDESKKRITEYEERYDELIEKLKQDKSAIEELQNLGVDNDTIKNRLGISPDSLIYELEQIENLGKKIEETKEKINENGVKAGNTIDVKMYSSNIEYAKKDIQEFGDEYGTYANIIADNQNKLFNTFKDTYNGISTSIGGNIYDLEYALQDLSNDGELTTKSIGNLAKILPELDFANMSSEEKVNALKDAIDKLKNSTDSLSEDSIKTAQSQVTSSIEQYSKIVKYQKQLSENGGKITLDLAKEFSDTKNGSFTDFMGNPEDMNQISEYFKNKIQEIANTHAEAMDTLKANDQSYYQEVLATGDLTNEKIREWASHFMDVNSESYHFDLNEYATVQQAKQGIIELLKQRFAEVCSNMTGIGAEEYEKDMGNYTTIQQAKQGVAQKLGQSVAQFLSDTLKIGADSYELDFKNFKSVQEAKAECLRVLGEQFDAINKKIGEDWVDLNVKYKNTIEGMQEDHPWTPEDQKLYKQQLESQLRDDVETRRLIAEKMEEIRKLEVPDLNRNLSDLSPLDKIDKDSGKNNNNNKDTQKTISLIETEIDRYKTLVERIKAYQNTIEQLNTEKENKSIAEQNNILLQQIGLYNQLKQAQINLRNAKQNRLNELKGILASNGFSFEDNGVIHNYTQQLEAIKQAKNALIKQNPDNKDLSKQFEQILSYANEYDTLITSDIPSLNKEISDIWNKIVNINKEILSNKAKEYLDKKQEYIDKELESIEKINEQREKENNLLKEKEELLDKQKDVAKAEQKLEEAKRTNDYELIKKRQEELEEAQKANNDTVYEQNYSAGTERLNDEKEYLNDYMDKLKEALSDENLLKLAQQGINDLTPTLNSLGQLSDKIPETFNDINNYTSNLTNEFTNFNSTLDEIQKKLSNINTLNIPNLNTGYISSPVNRNSKSVTVNKIEINNTINGGDTQEVTKKLNELNNGLDDRIVNKIGQLLNN